MFSSKYSVIPGFWLSLGYTLSWLSLIVLLPLAALFLYASHIHFDQLVTILSNRQLQSALKLSLYTSFYASLLASIFGAFLAWMLTRYSFTGKKIIDSMIDLPLALPTAIAGIALTTLYAPNGLLGSLLPFKVAYTPLGIIVAMVFVTIPFTVRTLEPIIKDIPYSVEEAAKTLGATPLQTFLYIIFPMLFPAWLTGFSLAMARSLGEYGSVVFIAANIPYKTEILPILIVSKLDQFDYTGATVISLLMLLISFGLLFFITIIQRWIKPHRLIWFITHLSLPFFSKKKSS